MKLIKRIFYWGILTLITLILGGGLAVYLFKDRIIQQVIAEVNQFLTTPVEVAKVDIDFLHGFPSVAVRFFQVNMQSGFGETLLDAEEVYALVSPFDLAKGNFDVDKIEIIDAKVGLKIDNKGRVNYNVFNKLDTANTATGSSDFNLQSILLEDVELLYEDARTKARHNLQVIELTGKISREAGIIKNVLSGEVDVKEIKIDNFTFSLIDPVDLFLEMAYTTETKKLTVEKSKFIIEGSEIQLDGEVDLLDKPIVDLNLSAENATIQLIASLLPSKFSSYLRAYQSKGKINLSSTLKGVFDESSMPELNSTYSLKSVQLEHSELNADVTDLNLSGTLQIRDIGKMRTGSLVVDKAEGLLMGKPFTLELEVVNFIEPKVNLDFTGTLNMEWLTQTIRYEKSKSASGSLEVNLNYTGSFYKNVAQRQETLKGNLVVNRVNVDLPNGTPISNLAGELSFSKGQISVSNLSGFLGKSELLLNGNITGLQTFAPVKNKQKAIRMSADLKAAYINLDEITETIIELSKDSANSSPTQIPPVDFSLDFIIKRLTFKRFNGENIVGELRYANDKLEVSHFGSKTMGGKVVVSGLLEQKASGDYYIEAYSKTTGIHIDSLFYVFNNFRQQFITDQYLKGQINAEAFTSMYFDKNWRLRRDLLKAETKLNVVNGELNNFAPIMALSRYLDSREDKLDQLRFGDLTTYVNIARDTVFIPEMTVKTNVRDIKVSGTHTLSQNIDYRLSVPVINENIDRDEAFGAVERVQGSSPNLLFRIKGTTTDYRVNYDLVRAVGKAFQLLDLKKTFEQKEQALDSVSLDEEEFDWNN